MILEKLRRRIRRLVKLPMVGGYYVTWKNLFLRWLYPPDDYEGSYHFEAVVRYDEDLLISIDTTSAVGWNIFCFGHYSKLMLDLFKSIVKEGDVVIEVGANIGDTTLILAKAAGDTGLVYAFEPFPIALEKLRENCRLNNFRHIKVMGLALSDTAGEMTLYCPTPDSKKLPGVGRSGITGMSCLARPGEEYMRGVHFKEVEVSVITLDQFVSSEKPRSVDFIKIDVEGFDYNVLAGGIETINTFKPYIIFEYDPVWVSRAGRRLVDAFNLLEGYRFYGLTQDPHRPLELLNDAASYQTGDILAVPTERSKPKPTK